MRRKSRNTLIIVVLLLAAVPLALKGVMYLRVKLALDDLVLNSAKDAEVTYGGIDTELRGAASVTDLRIRPNGFEEGIEIARLRVDSGDLWAFVRPDQWVGEVQPELPEQLRVDVQSITIPLEKAVLENLRKRREMLRAQGAELPGACESLGFDPAQLKAMGFQAVTLDLGMDYRFERADERLDVSLDFDFNDIESISMTMVLQGLVPEDIEAGNVAGARFARADVRVDLDPEFGERFVQQCAKQKQLSAEAYVESLIGSFRDNLKRSGITLGQELQQALEGYFRKWGEIRLYIKPAEPIAPLQLVSIKPERLVQTLGISLFVNDKPVNDLDVKIDLQQLARSPSKKAPARAAGATASSPPKRVRIVRRFRSMPVAELDQHLGETVRIQPLDQPVREGTLVAIVNGEAQVEQRAHGGKVTSYVSLKDIRAVEVLKIERQPLN